MSHRTTASATTPTAASPVKTSPVKTSPVKTSPAKAANGAGAPQCLPVMREEEMKMCMAAMQPNTNVTVSDQQMVGCMRQMAMHMAECKYAMQPNVDFVVPDEQMQWCMKQLEGLNDKQQMWRGW